MAAARHTCVKLEVPDPLEPSQIEPIFIKGTWFDSHFDLSITNGVDSWVCNASEEDVRERAAQWDQPLREYVNFAERYLGFRQPDSAYGFVDAGDGHRRLSWTFKKEGTTLEWRWKCQPSTNTKKTTAEVLDFLMDANIRLTEEVVRKTQSMEQLKVEAENCLAQSEKLNNEKMEFESAIYTKFLGVLNSKKMKLRELRNQLSEQKTVGKLPIEEESTDKTESFDDESDDNKSDKELVKQSTGTSNGVAVSNTARGGKRIKRK